MFPQTSLNFWLMTWVAIWTRHQLNNSKWRFRCGWTQRKELREKQGLSDVIFRFRSYFTVILIVTLSIKNVSLFISYRRANTHIFNIFQGKSNQHFNKNISATAFINSCQHLQFIYSASKSSKSKRLLPLPRDKILITIESKTLRAINFFNRYIIETI